jgi:hypothetical protein
MLDSKVKKQYWEVIETGMLFFFGLEITDWSVNVRCLRETRFRFLGIDRMNG